MRSTAFIILLLLFISCSQSRYTEMYEDAEKSSIENDSLFLGFEFGMSQDSFFKRCQFINDSAGLYDSSGKLRVGRRVEIDNENYLMNFYPIFVDEKLAVMPFEIQHESYSQWNKQYYSDKTLSKITIYFQEEFKVVFEEFNHPEVGAAYVNFTGNRRLRIYEKNQKLVGGEFMDMSEKFDLE